MNVEALNANPSAAASLLAAQAQRGAGGPTAAQLANDRKLLNLTDANSAKSAAAKQPAASDIKKAASQFEAIILRQLLEPSIEPVMSGGLGGGESSGGGIYGYMLTDTLASSLAQGGGLGWAKLLEKQLSPAHPGADNINKTESKT